MTDKPIKGEIVDKTPRSLTDSAKKGIPLEPILKYDNMGLSLSEIAKLLGCTKQNISNRLKQMEALRKILPNYQDNESEYWDLSILQDMLVKLSLTPSDLKKGIGRNIITSAAIAKDKSELAKGNQPSGININILVATIREKETRLKALQEKFESL